MNSDKIQVGDLWKSKKGTLHTGLVVVTNILQLNDDKLKVNLVEVYFHRVDRPEDEYCWTTDFFLEDYIKVS